MRQKLRNRFILIAETEAATRVRSCLDVIRLQPVIGIDIISVFANDRADHMDRINPVTPGRRLDLGDQRLVGRQKIDDLLVFALKRRVGRLGSFGGSTGNARLLGIAIARRHDRCGLHIRRRGDGKRQSSGKCQKSFAHERMPFLKPAASASERCWKT